MSDTEIQVFIKGIGSSTSNIIIDKNARVAELFEKYSEHIGLSGSFGLVYGGKELREADPNGKVMHIKDYGIEDESNIGAVMRLPGGSENEKRYGPKVKLSRKPDMLDIDDQAIDMSCGHAIGPNSMTHHVRHEVEQKKKHTICCPAVVDDTKNETCSHPWEFKKIKKVALFTKSERTDFEGKISDNYIRYALKSQQCPKCKSNCVRENKCNPRVICVYCTATSNVRFEFCWICLREWRTSGTNTCGNENCENQETDSSAPCTNNMSQTFKDMLGMWKEKANPLKTSMKYRLYSPTAMTSAYQAVKDACMPIQTAARQYGVPQTTLRDRVLGRIDPDTVSSGPQALFSQEQETLFDQHLKAMAELGYGYSRTEVTSQASNFALFFGLRDKNHPLSDRWFRGFMDRWPEMKVLKPRALSNYRAQASSKEAISSFFDNLQSVLKDNNLMDSPELIYNVDEKGVQTEHSPPYIVCTSKTTPAITSARSSTTTILACGNAIGSQIPPYFIFKGQRMRSELMEGSSPGAQGTVTDSGWSNTAIFLEFLETHFLKYVQRPNSESPVLLIYDGHK